MDKNLKAFYDKFQVEQNTIHKTKYWTLSLRPLQATLGSCVISLNRYCERLSEITTEESADFVEIAKITEDTLKTKIGYDKINYLMLMMIDPHLHYHVFPRYKEEKQFEGKHYIDEGWRTPMALAGENISRENADKLITLLKGE